MKYPRIFKKAIKGAVGGRFIDSRGDLNEFLLTGDPAKTDIDQITVEIPNEEAEKYFVKNNKKAIINGYLIEITDGYEVTLESVNAVSDGFLKDLLKEPITVLKKKVKEFTSPVPIERLLELALDANKPHKTIEFIKEQLSKFDDKPPMVGEVDGIKIGGS